MKTRLLATLCMAALASIAVAHDDTTANPLGLFWDNSYTNIEDYYHPGALLISGNCNRYDEHFTQARAAGAEVLTYLNPIEVYDRSPCQLSRDFYRGRLDDVPKWPYPSPGERINYRGTHMTDIRAGSPWSNTVVDYVTMLMREGKVDGVFLDVVGARLWSQLAQWKTWPKEEQDEWTLGNVDLVRRLDEARRRINPKFIIITNNLWDRGDALGLEGERHVDGVELEHPLMDEYHRKYAARPFADLGHKRVLVIARESPAEAVEWSKVPGVTHVTYQRKYDHPDKPLTPFRKLNDR